MQNGKLVPIAVKVGDRVMLPQWGENKVVMDDKEYFLYREAELLGKWE